MINRGKKNLNPYFGMGFVFFMTHLPCKLYCACLDSRVRLVNSSDLRCHCICICTGLSLTSNYNNISLSFCVKDFVILAAWLELVAFFCKKKKRSPIGMVCVLDVRFCWIVVSSQTMAAEEPLGNHIPFGVFP